MKMYSLNWITAKRGATSAVRSKSNSQVGGRQVGVTYIATEENKNYLGPASLDSIAATVYGSVGPSGANIDYVRRLAGALREIGGEDPDVFALEALLNNDNEPVD